MGRSESCEAMKYHEVQAKSWSSGDSQGLTCRAVSCPMSSGRAVSWLSWRSRTYRTNTSVRPREQLGDDKATPYPGNNMATCSRKSNRVAVSKQQNKPAVFCKYLDLEEINIENSGCFLISTELFL